MSAPDNRPDGDRQRVNAQTFPYELPGEISAAAVRVENWMKAQGLTSLHGLTLREAQAAKHDKDRAEEVANRYWSEWWADDKSHYGTVPAMIAAALREYAAETKRADELELHASNVRRDYALLQAERDRLAADKARLDWLAQKGGLICRVMTPDSFRAAIDAAMEAKT